MINQRVRRMKIKLDRLSKLIFDLLLFVRGSNNEKNRLKQRIFIVEVRRPIENDRMASLKFFPMLTRFRRSSNDVLKNLLGRRTRKIIVSTNGATDRQARWIQTGKTFEQKFHVEQTTRQENDSVFLCRFDMKKIERNVAAINRIAEIIAVSRNEKTIEMIGQRDGLVVSFS